MTHENNQYLSASCDVSYLPDYNAVFVKWKKFCCLEDYRAPLHFALEIIQKYRCDYVADTRTGFENIPEDTKWVADYFMPKAVESGCKCIYFIIDQKNALKDELEGQANDSKDLIPFRYIYDLEELRTNQQAKGGMHMTHEEKANQYFSDKFHCSQAVLAAFADELGLTEEQALKLGACFGSGMRKGEVCGACTGALMVLGLQYGHCIKGDMESRNRANEVNDRFLNTFRQRNGSYICNDLLGCDISTPEGAAYAFETKLFTDFCPKMVASAVRIIEEINADMKK